MAKEKIVTFKPDTRTWYAYPDNIMSDINIKCGCGKDAQYAVYSDRQPHCLSCMLDAVDVAMGVVVGTLDPWEQYPDPSPKGSKTYLMYAYQKKRTMPRKLKRYGCRV